MMKGLLLLGCMFIIFTDVNSARFKNPKSCEIYGSNSFGISLKAASPTARWSEREAHHKTSAEVQPVSVISNPAFRSVVRGSILRIASDLSGGTPLECIKNRVTVRRENVFKATRDLVKEGGFGGLWTGTPSRTVEGALLGAMFMVGSTVTKTQLTAMGVGKTPSALAGGLVGGLVQAIVMTPAGLIFTSLNVNKGKEGFENDNAITVIQRIVKEKGVKGMYVGCGPMAFRQASNWASRSFFTEVARTTFKMSEYGMLGEIGSGVIGGVGSCWNTPVETCRVLMQRDVSEGKPKKSSMGYVVDIYDKEGIPGLFRGVTPRGIQAVWQTVFMVVVPNILGV